MGARPALSGAEPWPGPASEQIWPKSSAQKRRGQVGGRPARAPLRPIVPSGAESGSSAVSCGVHALCARGAGAELVRVQLVTSSSLRVVIVSKRAALRSTSGVSLAHLFIARLCGVILK